MKLLYSHSRLSLKLVVLFIIATLTFGGFSNVIFADSSFYTEQQLLDNIDNNYDINANITDNFIGNTSPNISDDSGDEIGDNSGDDSSNNSGDNSGDDSGNNSDSDNKPNDTPPTASTPPINVLFVGNSSTYTNNIPMMVKGLCDASSITANIYSITASGYKLTQYANPSNSLYGELLTAIKSSKLDYIVLQEHRDNVIPSPDKTIEAIKSLLPYININNTKIIMYAQQSDFSDRVYSINGCYVDLSHDESQFLLAKNYSYIAGKFKAPVCPSGVNFTRSMERFPEIGLYNIRDRIHPTVAGSYLAACSLYKTIFKKTALNNLYLPGSIYQTSNLISSLDIFSAIKLQKIADANMDLSRSTLTINKGQNYTLTGTANYTLGNDIMTGYSNKTQYYSLDPNIASVNKNTGRISAFATGTTQIMATTDSGLMAFCTLKILQPATSISLSTTEKISLLYKETYSLSASLKPADCTDSITWKSSDTSIAVVSNRGVITAKKAGKVKISAVADSGISSSMTVYVKLKKPTKIKATVSKYKTSKKKVNISLKWSVNKNVNKYNIYRSLNPNKGFKKIGSSTKSSYIDKALSKNVVYYYKIRAIHTNGSCNSAYSSSKTVSTNKKVI